MHKINALFMAVRTVSIKTGQVSKTWKMSKITTIPKKTGVTSDPQNYRQISIESCLEKLILFNIRMNNILNIDKVK
ncbi:reverse [Brachionus plicatilis]|uniref:Reverse n=1 Tax=Brachionus plicatilis TaxID=10195 RepID=A0A3M7S387_BRAPC|nr:reverse [Brachionus plicatilis]